MCTLRVSFCALSPNNAGMLEGYPLLSLSCSWVHNLVDTLTTRKWKLGSFVGYIIDPGAHFGTLLSKSVLLDQAKLTITLRKGN